MSSQVTISTGAKRRRVSSSTGSKKSKRTMTKTPKWTVQRNFASVGKTFPQKLNITHKYVEVGEHTFAAATYYTFFYKCNGLFDPRDAIGGHQPLMYDQMAALYNHYAVTKSRIKVTLTPVYPGSTTAGPCLAGAYIDDNTTGYATLEAAVEALPGNSFKTCSLQPITYTTSWKAVNQFGSPNVLDNPRLQGTSGSDPTELSHFALFFYNPAPAGSNWYYVYEIEYDTTWFELKNIVGS